MGDPADNLKTNMLPVAVSGVVDETSSVTVKLNTSGPVSALLDVSSFNLAVMPEYGMNTLEVTATDLAENTSSVKRTMTFDDRKPYLSVTEPAQDVKTNKAAMTLRGETTDLTGIEVRITMDGNIYLPVITEGKFEQAVVFEEQKTYPIYVTVTDEAGNETIAQRNVVYDTTAPLVTLNPAASPTNKNSEVLTGTVDESSTVRVTCSTASVSEVTYPTPTTWTVTLTNLKQGENTIMVNAVDEAGNASAPLSATITVFSYTAGGAFVIGDGNAATGSSVTFWGSQWSKMNTLSNGSANASFKGFADSLSSNPPSCGGKWTASTGASSWPPASIPDYMAVIVSDKITKTGNTISGDIKEIVIVKTAPGYQPAPAYPGMGTVVGTLCRNNSQMSLVSINTFPSLEGRDKGRVKPLLLASVGSTSQLLNSSTTTEALYFYHTDHLGTPMMMTDQNQAVVWEGEFLPFGEPYSITGTVTNNLRFPGQYYDEETGLHQNWHRDYRPGTGTYIQKDPIGFEGGSINLYSYVGNNPVNFVDPEGLLPPDWNNRDKWRDSWPFRPPQPKQDSTEKKHYRPFGPKCGPQGSKLALWIPDITPDACEKHDKCYDECAERCAGRECKRLCDYDLAADNPIYGAATLYFGNSTYNKAKKKEGCCQ